MRYALFMLGILAAMRIDGCLPEQAPGTEAKPCIVASGDLNNLCVAVPADVTGSAGFQYWQRDARGMWRGGRTGQGRPAAMTAWGESLLVFFESGRYGLFGFDRPLIHPSPVPLWKPAAVCEDGLAADAFGWDAAGDPVYARYEDEKWSWRRAEVPLEPKRVRDPRAARFGGRFFVVWREEVPLLTEPGSRWRLRFIYLEKDKWFGPNWSRLYVASAPHIAADGQTLACLYLKPAEGEQPERWTLATYAKTDEDWHEVGPVQPALPTVPAALGRQGSRFYMATLTDAGPQVAPLDVRSAKLEEPVSLATGEEDRALRLQPGTLLAVGLVLLASLFLLAALLRARTRPGAVSAGQPVPLMPAPVLLRGAACLFDYMLVGLASAWMFPPVPPDFVQRLLAGDLGMLTDLLVIRLVGFTLIAVYFTATEGIFGQTLGKRLFGIEVRSETGARMTVGQAIIRNVLRFVDELPAVYLLGLVLIMVGPKPQRLGDRLGKTLVVIKVRERSPEPDA